MTKQIAGAALLVAAANDYSVAVAISDDGGHLLCLERMGGANFSSVDSSSNKTVAAVIYKQPTKNFADRLAQGETLVLKLPGAMPVEGGFPLIVDGKVIAAGASRLWTDECPSSIAGFSLPVAFTDLIAFTDLAAAAEP